ncbi:MAG: IS66 family transposase [Ethanoligenens sp.]
MENESENKNTGVETVTIPRPEYDELRARNAELNRQVQWLMEQVRLAKHRQFGASSEKSEYDQLNLFNEAEVDAESHAAEPELTVVEQHYRKKAKEFGDSLPSDLPVETVEHTLPADEQVCPECGGPLHVMGKEVRRELKLIPAKAVIVEHVTYAYSCRCCEHTGCSVPVLKAKGDTPVIKGSFASPEAVAQIMVQKFVAGMPLYRQEQEFTRNGILLSRQTMSNWLVRCAEDWLKPIYDAFHGILCHHQVLHADETVLQVLHEPGKTAQSKSYMWLYRTSSDAEMPIVLYDYQPDRRTRRPTEFLKGFQGYLHTDGYSGYHNLPEEITVVGCWAHARRKFDEALKGVPPGNQDGTDALRGKQYCDRLFALERELAGCTPEERLKKRRDLAKPILDEYLSWLHTRNPAQKTGFGKAVHYVLDQWPYLERYLLDGRLEISNNRAERSIKPFVIDRKNFLFANTSRGAGSSAVIFSIIETAKENGLNPYEYLTEIFRRAPRLDSQSDANAWKCLLPNSLHIQERCKLNAATH